MACFRQQVLFRHLEKEQKEFVARAMFVMEFKSGDTIISQGEDGDNFYVIDRGKVECYKYSDSPDDEALVHTYSPGGAFGELAIMYNAPRAATCRAIADCRLYALDRKVHRVYPALNRRTPTGFQSDTHEDNYRAALPD